MRNVYCISVICTCYYIGNGITTVNNANSGMGLMLTPPSIFIGNQLTIVSPKLNAEVVAVTTPLGLINLSIGFEGGK